MEKNKHKNFLSIRTKITISIVAFVLVSLSLVFYISYSNTKKIMREDLDLRLLNMVNIAVLHVDVDKHSTLVSSNDEGSQNYNDIKKDLQDVRNHSTDIRYIYTMRENKNNEITFIVDAEENPDNISHLGDIYTEANQFPLNDFLSINKPVIEKEFTTDKWGTWISGYAPFYDKNGRRDGVLGIDIKASSVISMEKKMLVTYLISFISSGILAIILGLMLSRIITKSILLLTSIIKNSSSVEVPISNDEVGELAGVLKTTLDEKNINQKNTEEKISDKTKMLEKMNKLMIGRELEMIKLKKENADLKKSQNPIK